MDSRKILLLSDGSNIFPVLDRFFTGAGYEVQIAYSNQGAVDALRTGDFHLLITRMTRNRLEALTILKSMRKLNPRIMAIILKGDHEVNSPIEAYQVRGSEEIFIPCGWGGLRRLVANCLSG